jgi:RimJ/RimL family protein N-acetyltransferase
MAVTALMHRLASLGCRAIILFADNANVASTQTYLRLGYRPLRERCVEELTLPPL